MIEASDKPEKPEKWEGRGRTILGDGIWRRSKRRTVVTADTREAIRWARKARDNIAKGNWAEAIRAATAAIALRPGLSAPYADRCFAYYKRTLYDDAVRIATRRWNWTLTMMWRTATGPSRIAKKGSSTGAHRREPGDRAVPEEYELLQ